MQASTRPGSKALVLSIAFLVLLLALMFPLLVSADGLVGVSVSAPSTVLIGNPVNFTVTFSNTSSTQMGYGPYLDLYIPTTGKDGDDGITFIDATYLGFPLYTVDQVFPPSGCLPHPVAKDSSGTPLTVCGTPGDHFVVLVLPFAGITPGQIPLDVQVNATLSNLADLDKPLTISATGGFEFGTDPYSLYPAITTTVSSAQVTPTVILFNKEYIGPENETATGPNFPRQYLLTAIVAPGQRISNTILTDVLAPKLAYLSIGAVNPPVYTTIRVPAPAGVPYLSPTSTVAISWTAITGSGAIDAQASISYFVPMTDANGLVIINPQTGDDIPIGNQASLQTDWQPIDTRDPLVRFTLSSDIITFTAKSVAIQKGVSVITDTGYPGPTPGDIIQYTLDFQVSDYFVLGDYVISDTMSDGQVLLTAGPYTPTISAGDRFVSLDGSLIPGARFFSQLSGIDCTTFITIDISGAMRDLGSPTGILVGGLVSSTITRTAATGRITFYARIQDKYDCMPPYNSLSPLDRIDNRVVISGQVLSGAGMPQSPTRYYEDDNSSAGLVVPETPLSKTIYAKNGVLVGDELVVVAPGDLLTFRIRKELSTSDFKHYVLIDVLNNPSVLATDIITFSAPFSSTTPPPVGEAYYYPDETVYKLFGIIPTLTISSTANTLTWDYGLDQDTLNQTSTVDILFTVLVQQTPFIDRYRLTNVARDLLTNAGNTTLMNTVGAQYILTQPILRIQKGVVAAQGSAPEFSPSTVGPVTFTTPGGVTCPRFSSPITSSLLALNPIDSDLSGMNAGDKATFAIVIENTGTSSRGAFDVVISDTMPAGFTLPVSSPYLNLCVVNGAGEPITYTLKPGGLFGEGIELVDPSLEQGAIKGSTDAAGRNIVIITYDLLIDTSAKLNTTLVNTAVLHNYASQEGGLDHTLEDLTDDASVSLLKPLVSKMLISTGQGLSPLITIGEVVTYRVVITVPQGTISNARFIDNLPAGLALVNVDSVTASAALSTSYPGGWSAVAAATAIATGGISFTVPFSDVVNSNTNNAVSETITITLRAVVLNQANNSRGGTKTNTGSVIWNTGQTDVLAAPLTIIEPTLTLAKTTTPSSADRSDVITFTLTVTHSGASNATAYDTVLTDIVPAGMTYVPGSLVSTGGLAPTLMISTTSGMTVTWDQITVGTTSVLQFRVTLDPSVVPSQRITNTGNIRWTSLPGTVTSVSTHSTVSCERTGDTSDCGTTQNTYRTNASVTKVIHAPRITKSIIATELGTGTTVVPGEIITYQVVISIPEGTSPNATFTDILSSSTSTGRIVLVSIDSIQASPDLSTDYPGSWAGSLANAVTTTGGVSFTIPFSTVTNSNADNAVSKYITITYRVIAPNIGMNIRGRTLRNQAYWNWSLGTVNVQAPILTVAEPTMQITKVALPTRGDAGDVVTFYITLTNNSPSNATAYDVVLTDVIPVGLTYVNSSLQLVSGAPASQVTITAPSLALGWSSFTLTNISVYSFQVTLDTSVEPLVTYTNNVSVKWTSLPGDPGTRSIHNPASCERTGTAGCGELNNYVASSSAGVGIPAPVVSKTIVSTELGNGTRVAVGEIITYRTTISIPEGTTNGARFNDQLAAGLVLISIDSVEASPALSTSSGSWSGITATAIIAGDGLSFTIPLATITNTDTSNSVSEYITITYRAVVVNISTNTRNKVLQNTATWYWSRGSRTANTTVTVIEPTLTLSKVAQPRSGDAGDTITFTLIVSSVSPSNAVSYDALLTDIVPAGMTFVPGSLVSISGQAPTVITDSTAPSLALYWSNFLTTTNSVLQFRVILQSSVIASQTITNTANLVWTSLPGAATGRTTYNSFGCERTGSTADCGAANNTYRTSATDTIRVLTPSINKIIMGTELGNGPSVAVGEVITYRVTITVPEGVVPGVVYSDSLPSGMALVDITIDANAALSTNHSGSWSGVIADTAVGPGGAIFTMPFNSITNTDTDDAVPELLTITYRVVVLNVSGNIRGTNLINAYRWSWDLGSSSGQASQVTVSEPSLTLTKTASPTTGDAGDVVTFTLTLKHAAASNATAYNVLLTDIIPVGLTYVSGSVASLGTSTSTMTITALSLSLVWDQFAVGSISTVTFRATYDQNVVPFQVITNAGRAFWTSMPGTIDTPRSSHNSNSCERTGVAGACGQLNGYTMLANAPVSVQGTYSVSKALVSTSLAFTTDPKVTIGEVITWSLTISLSEGVFNNLVVTDSLPSGLAWVPGGFSMDTTGFAGTVPVPSVSTLGGSGDPIAFTFSQITSTGDNIAGNSSFTLRFQARVQNQTGIVDGRVLTNSAAIQLPGGPVTTSNPVTVTVIEPNLVINKLFVPDQASPGDQVQVHLRITNTGQSTAFGVSLDDLLPTGLINPSAGSLPNGFLYSTIPASTVRFSGGTIAASESVTIVFTTTLASTLQQGAVLRNVVTITQYLSLPPETPGGRTYTGTSAFDNLTVILPDLSISKTDGLVVAVPGQVLTYSLTISNTGTRAATTMLITDTLPDHTTYVAASASNGGSYNPGTRQVTWSLPGLSIGAQQVLTYQVTLDSPWPANTPRITNTAVISDATYPDPTPANNSTRDVDEIWAPTMSKTLLGSDLGLLPKLTVGEIVTYRVVITIPQASAANARFFDNLPAGVALVNVVSLTPSAAIQTSHSGGWSGVLADVIVASGGISFTLPFDTITNTDTNDTVTENITVTYRAVVLNTSANLRGTALTNTATFASQYGSLSASTTVSLAEPALVLVKTVDAATAGAGSTVTFTLSIQHAAASDGNAYDVLLTDIIPVGLTYVPGSLATVSGLAPLTITQVAPNLSMAWSQYPLGSQTTLTFRATFTQNVVPLETLTNTARLAWTSLPGAVQTPRSTHNPLSCERTGNSGDCGELNNYAVTSQASIQVFGDYAISKALAGTSLATSEDPNVTIGEVITFSLSISLSEGIINGLVINDLLPAELAFVSGSLSLNTAGFAGSVSLPAVITNGNSITFTFGTITVTNDGNFNNNSFMLLFRAIVRSDSFVAAGNVLTNQATIQLPGMPITTSNPITVAVIEPNLVISKLFVPDQASPGDQVQVHLRITNTGQSTAFGVSLDDLLPTGLINPSAGSLPNGFLYSFIPASTVRFSGGTIAASESVTIVFTTTLASTLQQGAVLHNVVTITQYLSLPPETPGGRTYTGPSASDDLTVILPDLSIVKTDGLVVAVPGQVLTYSLTISNTGTRAATTMLITDTLPDRTAFVSASNGGSYNPGTRQVTWSLPGLSIGAQQVLTYQVTVDSPWPANTPRITNTAVISDATYPDPTPANNSTLDVDEVWAPTMSKTLLGSDLGLLPKLTVGEIVTYRVVITIPQASAANARFFDNLPSGIALANIVSLDPSAAIQTSHSGGWSGVLTDVIVASGGVSFTLPFDTITNTDTNDTVAETITVTYRAVVLNISANLRGTALTNTATFASQYGSLSASTTVSLAEPEMSLTKTVTPLSGDAGDMVTFTLTIQHAAASDGVAYDVLLTDIIPVGLTYVTGTLQTISGTAPTTITQVAPVLSMSWNQYPLGSQTTLSFRATLDQEVQPFQMILNQAHLTWTSLAGAVQSPRSTHNPLSCERTGNSGDCGQLNNYFANAQAGVGVIGTYNVTKALVNSSHPGTQDPSATIGEIITYSLSISLSEGVFNGLVVTDVLPYGLGWVPASLSIDTTGFTGSVPAPVIATAASSGDDISFTFNQLAVTGDNIVTNNTFTLRFQVRVLDVLGPNNSDILSNSATIQLPGGPITTSNVVTTNILEPSLVIDKQIVPDQASPSDLVLVRLVVTNTGTTNAYDITVNDPLPAGMIYPVAVNTPVGFTYSEPVTGTVRYTGGPLAPNQAVVFTYSVTLANNLTPGTVVTNVATIQEYSTLPGQVFGERTYPGPSATATLVIILPDLQVSKSDGILVAVPGQTLTYTIRITNTGTRAATSVVVTDTLPPNSTYVTGSASLGGVYDPVNRQVSWLISTISISVNLNLTYQVTLDNPWPQNVLRITNVVTATDGHYPDLTPENNTGRDTDELWTPTMVKTLFGSELGNSPSLVVGEIITYRTIITIPQASAANARFVDTLPAGMALLDVVSLSASSAIQTSHAGGWSGVLADVITAAGGVSFTLPFDTITNTDTNDAIAETITITYRAVVLNTTGNQDGTRLTNNAVFSCQYGSLTSTTSVTVTEPVLTLDKTASPTTGDAGDVVTFTLTIQQDPTSTAVAYDVLLTDVIPAGMTYMIGSLATVSGDAPTLITETVSGLTLLWNQLLLDSSSTLTFNAMFNQSVNPFQVLTNTARTSWTSLPGNPSSPRSPYAPLSCERTGNPAGCGQDNTYATQDSASVSVLGIYSITKALDGTSLSATPGSDATIGEIVTYSLAISISEGTINGLVVTDTLPAGMTYLTGTLSLDSAGFAGSVTTPTVISNANTLVFSFATVVVTGDNQASNNRFILRFQAKVNNDPQVQAGNNLLNSAQIRLPGRPITSSEIVTVTVVEPNLTIDKVFVPDQASPTDQIIVQFVVTNTGTSPAYDIVISDPLPFGLITPMLPSIPGGYIFSLLTPTSVQFTGGPLLPGDAVTLVFSVTLDSSLTIDTLIHNTVTISSYTSLPGIDPGERTYTGPSAIDDLLVILPDLTITKTDDTPVALPGQTLTYTITVANVGTRAATNARITDTLPDYATFVPGSATLGGVYDSATRQVRWLVANIGIAESITLTYQVVLDNPWPQNTPRITNVITVTDGRYTDPTPGDNTSRDIDELWLPGMSKVLVGSELGKSPLVTVGEIITYRTVITFPQVLAANASYVDTLASGLALMNIVSLQASTGVSTSHAGGWAGVVSDVSVVSGGGVFTLPFGTIFNTNTNDAVAETITVTYRAVVLNTSTNLRGTALENNALFSCQYGTLTGTTTVTLTEPSLTLTKTVSPASGDAGDVFTFTLTVQHAAASNGVAYDVVLSDIVPLGLTYVPGSLQTTAGVAPTSFSDTAPNLSLLWNQYPVTATSTLSFQATLDQNVTPYQNITNTARLSWTSLPGDRSSARSQYNSDACERTGNPNGCGQLNPYAVESAAAVQVIGVYSIAKAFVGSSLGDTAGTQVTIGEVITYSLAISVSEGVINGLQITDVLPLGLTYISGSLRLNASEFAGTVALPSAAFNGSTLVLSFAPITSTGDNIATNNTFVLNFQASVVDDPSVTRGVVLSNSASIQMPGGPITTSQVVTVTVVEPELVINKQFIPSEASPADQVRILLVITNTGNSSAYDITIDDPLPAGLTNPVEAATPAGFVFSVVAPNTVRYTGTALAPNQSVTFAFTVTLAADVAPDALINNTATISQYTSLPGVDPNERTYVGPSDDDDLQVVTPDITVSKTDGVTVAIPGQTLTYTITVTNTGTRTGTNVAVTDTLPDHVTYVAGSASDGGVYNPGTRQVQWVISSLPIGASVQRTFRVVIDTDWPNDLHAITNTVEAADGVYADPTPDDNTDRDIDEVLTNPLLVATKMDTLADDYNQSGQASAGDTLTYTVMIQNIGMLPAENVVVSDTPAIWTDLVVGTVSTTQGQVIVGNTPDDKRVQVNIGTLAGGASATITFKVWISVSLPSTVTSIYNQAIITSTNTPPTSTDDPGTIPGTDPTITPIDPVPTAVTLLYFRIDGSFGTQVTLAWATATEINNLGFKIYRAPVNDRLQSLEVHFEQSHYAGPGLVTTYSYVDIVPQSGDWWYWLVDVDTEGKEMWHDLSIVANVMGFDRFIFLPTVFK